MPAQITPNQLVQLIIPGTAAVFSLGFACALYDRRLRYLRFLAASYVAFAFALGSAVQICHLSDESPSNALISATFYMLSIQLLAEVVLRRAGLHLRPTTHASMFALVLGGMYYFSFVASNLLVRVYLLNLSAGLLMEYRGPFQEALQWAHRQPLSSLGAADFRREFFHQDAAHYDPNLAA
jgi:hypothetical protein